MGAKRVEYQIVGRYMDGKEIVGYHLQSLETGKAARFNKEQVAYLVGRGQVTNCEGQIYKDKVLFRGANGVSLDSLPVIKEDGTLTHTDKLGKVRKDTTAQNALTQVMIVGLIVRGRETAGYVVQNAGGGQTQIPRAQLLQMAQEGKVGNARVQMYQGKPILKGVNCDIRELPKQTV